MHREMVCTCDGPCPVSIPATGGIEIARSTDKSHSSSDADLLTYRRSRLPNGIPGMAFLPLLSTPSHPTVP